MVLLFLLLHPRTELRIAGGREHNLRSLQPLALYPADSVFVNGYLTTPGQPAADVWRMIEDLGFDIQVDALPTTRGSTPTPEPAVGLHS